MAFSLTRAWYLRKTQRLSVNESIIIYIFIRGTEAHASHVRWKGFVGSEDVIAKEIT